MHAGIFAKAYIKMRKEKSEKQSIKTKLLDLLSRREYSRAELEQKIKTWLKRQQYLQPMENDSEGGDFEFEQSIQNELQEELDKFEAKGWLSDERYVESFINQKASRLGGARLRQELKTKGIHEDLVSVTLEQLENSEFERAHDVWERKFKVLPIDAKSYHKQMRFLIYRGFAVDIIKKILNEANVQDK